MVITTLGFLALDYYYFLIIFLINQLISFLPFLWFLNIFLLHLPALPLLSSPSQIFGGLTPPSVLSYLTLCPVHSEGDKNMDVFHFQSARLLSVSFSRFLGFFSWTFEATLPFSAVRRPHGADGCSDIHTPGYRFFISHLVLTNIASIFLYFLWLGFLIFLLPCRLLWACVPFKWFHEDGQNAGQKPI